MTPITAWSRMLKNDEGVVGPVFNHIEDGHCANDTPTPKLDIHKKVWGGKWSKEFAHLTDTVPAVLTRD